MTKVKLIHVGLGGWGTQWAQEILPSVESVEVAAFVDANPAALARMEATGTPAKLLFPSLAAALEAVPADGVLAVVRTPVHQAVVSEALRAGRHVLVEKPFAMTVEEAQKLVALADQRQRMLFVSQNYRFFPTPLAAAAIVHERAYGAPLAVEIDFRRYIPEGHVYPNEANPLLVDMAIHHFDLMRFILGEEPVEVSCRTWNPVPAIYKGAPSAAFTALFDKGTVVTWRGSYLSRGPATPWSGEWRIDLEKASLAFAFRGEPSDRLAPEMLTLTPVGEAMIDLTPPPFQHVDRAGTLAAFAEAIQLGAEVPPRSRSRNSRGATALPPLATREAITQSCSGVAST